jgi:putative acetyltransferase
VTACRVAGKIRVNSLPARPRNADNMIRIFQHGEHRAIAEIFTRAIHEIACRAYTSEQCLAWSDREPNYEHWRRRCELKRPFVAITDATISGFLELDPDGHIDCAYINPDFQRRGIMTRLVEHAVETCFAFNLGRVYVEASICARPLFEKLGFSVLNENIVTVKGVELLNYRMERSR